MYYILIEERQGDRVYREFVCDTTDDLDLVKEASFGDIAIVAGPPSVYLRNSHKNWVLL